MTRECLAAGLTSARASALAVALLLACTALSSSAQAQSARLDGVWSGGGSVSLASGEKERAQCRANYSRTSATSYEVKATCATPSGRASQTATLRHVGGNSYQGTFYNSEYVVRGIIHVTVGGNRQTVRLTSEAASASLELRCQDPSVHPVLGLPADARLVPTSRAPCWKG